MERGGQPTEKRIAPRPHRGDASERARERRLPERPDAHVDDDDLADKARQAGLDEQRDVAHADVPAGEPVARNLAEHLAPDGRVRDGVELCAVGGRAEDALAEGGPVDLVRVGLEDRPPKVCDDGPVRWAASG